MVKKTEEEAANAWQDGRNYSWAEIVHLFDVTQYYSDRHTIRLTVTCSVVAVWVLDVLEVLD